MVVDLALNLPSLLSLGGIAAAFVWRLSHMDSRQGRTEEKVEELRSDRSKHDHRIRNTEQGQVVLVAELKAMADLLREVRDDLREVLRGRP